MFGHPRIALFRNDKPVRIQKKVPRNGLVTANPLLIEKRAVNSGTRANISTAQRLQLREELAVDDRE